jgi:F0F1-type ATP synthase assembly protein I
MTQSPKKVTKSTPTTPMTISPAILMLSTAFSTTWRFFLPIIIGTFAGIGLDDVFHTAPLFVIIILVISVGVSALLIAQQLRDVKRPQK